MNLDIFILYGPRGRLFLVSEVALHMAAVLASQAKYIHMMKLFLATT